MTELPHIPDTIQRTKRDTFTLLFLLTHRMEYITDKHLQHEGLTTKQLLTLLIIGSAFDWRGPNYKPSLSDVADQMSTSHQNIRQITRQLEAKGFIKTTKDPHDKRILRLRITQHGQYFFDTKAEMYLARIIKLFGAISTENMLSYYKTTWTLVEATTRLYEEAKK